MSKAFKTWWESQPMVGASPEAAAREAWVTVWGVAAEAADELEAIARDADEGGDGSIEIDPARLTSIAKRLRERYYR